MTVNNSANKVIAAGNGVQTVFNFSFIAVEDSDLSVILTDSSGNETTLASALYTVVRGGAGQVGYLSSTIGTLASSGKGGDSVLGFGAPATAVGNGSVGPGAPVNSYGGGGSGAQVNNLNSTANGGAGGPGILIVTEYLAFAA